MSTKVMFTAAGNLVHKDEKIENVGMVLWDGDLYFNGRKSEFVIKQFIEGDAHIRLTYDDLRSITSLGDNIKVVMIDRTMASFSNGRNTMRIPVQPVSTAPTISTIDESLYKPVTDTYTYASPIFDIAMEHTHVNALQGASPAIGAFDQNFIAATFGDIVYEMSLTDVRDMFRKAVTHKADIAIHEQKIYIRAVIDGQWIFSVSVITKPIVTKIMTDYLNRMAVKDYEQGHLVTVRIPGKMLTPTLATIESLGLAPQIVYKFTNGMLEISGTDKNGREFKSVLDDVETTESISMRAHTLTRSILGFISAPFGGIDKAVFVFSINATTCKYYLEAEPVQEKDRKTPIANRFMAGYKRV